MALEELRGAKQLTQSDMAEMLDVPQSSISRIEQRADMYLSTLRNYIHAVGGELRIQADCTAHARAFLLDPRWAWNAARTLGVETPPLPLPAVRATTILPFKPQPQLVRAAD